MCVHGCVCACVSVLHVCTCACVWAHGWGVVHTRVCHYRCVHSVHAAPLHGCFSTGCLVLLTPCPCSPCPCSPCPCSPCQSSLWIQQALTRGHPRFWHTGLRGSMAHRVWAPTVPRLPEPVPVPVLVPAALSTQQEPGSAEGPVWSPLLWLHAVMGHIHTELPRRWGASGARLGKGGPSCLPPPRPLAPLLSPQHPAPGPIVRPRRAAGQDFFVRARQYFILTINQTRPGPQACL